MTDRLRAALAEMPEQVMFQSLSGDAATRIANHSWDLHPLGVPSTWPGALRVALGTALRSPEAMFIAWGPDLFSFFNDAYGEILGAKIEDAVGRRFPELWSEVWEDIAPIADKALAGTPSRFVDMPLTMMRNGVPEKTWWTFSYSPLIDEIGSIVGMLCVTNETTAQVLNGRRQAFRDRLDEAIRPLDDPAKIKAAANAMLGEELQAGAVGYGDAQDDRGERTLIEQDWVVPGFPSAAGLHALEDYGTATRADLKAGRIIRIDDTATNPATGPQTSQAFAQIGTRAFINVPLVKDGRFVALQYILSPIPRRWTDHEVALAVEVAERTWSAVERARAETAMREDRRSLATLNGAAAALAGELDLDRLVQTVTDAGVALTGAQFGAFFYNVENVQGESYMLYTLSGVDRSAFDKFPMPRNTAIFAPTFGGEGVVRSADILTDARYGHNAPHKGMPAGHLPVRSYLAAPVTSRSGEVIGGLFFGHPEADRFDARHEESIVAIAAQAAIAIDNSRLFSVAKRDLEERRAAETRLKELNDTLEQRIAQALVERREVDEALRQAQKMEAIGQLTGGVAHDFNNLLTVIRGSIDLIRRPDVPEHRRAKYVDAIAQTADRATKLTAQLLAFARRQSLQPEVFDAREAVRSIGAMVTTLTGSRITLEQDLPDYPCFVNVDPNQFDTALVNIAINARDAMDGEGALTIVVRAVSGLPAIRERSGNHEAYIAVSITDTGSGIEAGHLTQIFEPFFTTKTVGKGTGLGLSQVFGFSRQSGGEVQVESTSGSGTTFTLYLPQSSAPDILKETAEPGQLVQGHGLWVLVVEDNEDVGTFATQALAELGYNTAWAANGDEALALLEKQPDRFNIVFSDVIMPGINGVDLGLKIREIYHDLPVILTSGYSHVLAKNGTYGFDLLHKPYSIEQLSKVLLKAAVWHRRKEQMGE